MSLLNLITNEKKKKIKLIKDLKRIDKDLTGMVDCKIFEAEAFKYGICLTNSDMNYATKFYAHGINRKFSYKDGVKFLDIYLVESYDGNQD